MNFEKKKWLYIVYLQHRRWLYVNKTAYANFKNLKYNIVFLHCLHLVIVNLFTKNCNNGFTDSNCLIGLAIHLVKVIEKLHFLLIFFTIFKTLRYFQSY